jgi:ribosomal protein S18 acetylase RimI-like enzyme
VDVLYDIKYKSSTALLASLGHSLDEIAAWQDRFCTREYLISHVKAPHAMYVVEQGGEVMGMAGLTLKDDGDDSICCFNSLYCLENAVGLGYGSRLTEHRLGVTENFNIDFIQCHVHGKNEKAQRFVEHYGFEKHGLYTEPRLRTENIVYRRIAE